MPTFCVQRYPSLIANFLLEASTMWILLASKIEEILVLHEFEFFNVKCLLHMFSFLQLIYIQFQLQFWWIKMIRTYNEVHNKTYVSTV